MEIAKAEIKTHKVSEPIVYLNDKYLVGMDIVHNGTLPSYLKNCGYEKTFRIRSLKQLHDILSNAAILRKDIRERIRQYGFKKTTCSFVMETRLEIPLKEQKEMVDFQVGLFDEVTVTNLDNDPQNTQHCIDYAKSKSDDVALLTDFKFNSNDLEFASTLVKNDKGIHKLKVRYRRLTGSLDKFRMVAQDHLESDKKLHLVLVNKKTSMFGIENIATEFLTRVYGFTSYSQYFREEIMSKKKGKAKRFILLGFVRATLLYEKTRGNSLRGQQLQDLGSIDAEMRALNQSVVASTFPQYVATKTIFSTILAKL